KNQGDLLVQPSKFANAQSHLFENFVFFVSREVPLDISEFIILAAGGSVISELTIDELKIRGETSLPDLSKVTHQISDRPKIPNRVQGRTYVQPQWIFDCVNKGELLNINLYLPGETLPPHLSPWGDGARGYNPEEELPEAEEESEEESDPEVAEGDEDVDEDEDEELQAQKELELEAQGVKYSEVEPKEASKPSKKRKAAAASTAEDEEKELKTIMMTNKQRKLYKKMQYSN
ncbi:hypothetical protein WICPIJ_002038, partial [Wickerhamomyces pijperi]